MPAGAFRGYGLPQTLIAVEAAIDELAKQLGISPFEMRRRNVVKPGDPMLSPPASEYHDVDYGSYGLDQCLDLVERAMQADAPKPELSPDWLIGDGIALTMIDTVPPAGHFADCVDRAARRRRLRAHRRHRRVRQRHQRPCTGRSRRPRWRPPSTGSACASPTPPMAATTPAPMAAPAPSSPAARRRPRRKQLATEIKAFAAGAWPCDAGACTLERRSRRQRQRSACPLPSCASSRASAAQPLAAHGNSGGTPRSVAFNVQGFRVAVNKGTGEISILKSVQAADAGRVANPMQCRGQVEGGVAQSLGATLYEEMVIDDDGRVVNPRFRDYHLPSFADVPRTEVFFADTSDTIGPLGAKSMSESPYNPVAAALGNAIARRHRHPLHRDAVQAGPAVSGAAGEVW